MSVVNIESFDKQDKVIFADLNAEIILFSKGSHWKRVSLLEI